MPVAYLNIEQFVEMHPGLNVMKIRRLVKAGLIAFSQPGGKGNAIYIPEDAFDRIACRASSEAETGDEVVAVDEPSQPRRRGRVPDWKRNQ